MESDYTPTGQLVILQYTEYTPEQDEYGWLDVGFAADGGLVFGAGCLIIDSLYK
jgi:hypothetical protein